MTRNGKIARLPFEIREELNRKLLNGEQSKRLVKWLNEQPTVKRIIAQQFHGQPITESNLSEWKTGGFVEWRNNREIHDSVSVILGQSPEMVAAVQGGLIDQMAVLLAAHTLVELKRLPLTALSEEKNMIGLHQEGSQMNRMGANLSGFELLKYVHAPGGLRLHFWNLWLIKSRRMELCPFK